MLWIRWYGLVIFVVLVSLISAVVLLFIDPVARRGIEKVGTKVVGAEVNLADFSSQLAAGRINLTKLAVTNPDEPMKNALEIGQASFGINLSALVDKKVIIDEVKVLGLFLNTDRKKSGAIIKPPKPPTQEGEKITIPGVDLPSKDEVLASASLESMKKAEALKQEIANAEQRIKDKIEALPKQEKIDAYKERLKALTGGGKDPLAYLKKAKDLKQLKKEIEADLDLVKELKNSLKSEISSTRDDIKNLKSMVKGDVKSLMNKVGLGDEGAIALVETLFGPKVKSWLQKGLYWYQRVKPYLAKASTGEGDKKVEAKPSLLDYGRVVNFPSPDPRPKFHVKNIEVSKPENEKKPSLYGLIKHISTEPKKVAEPASIDLSGSGFTTIKNLSFRASLDQRQEESKNSFHLKLEEMQLSDVSLVDSENFPVAMKKAKLNFRSNVHLNDKQLNGELLLDFSDSEIATNVSADDNEFEKIIKQTLAQTSSFQIIIDLAGDIDSPKLAIKSNLDDVLKKASGKLVAEKVATLKADVQKSIEEKLATEQAQLSEKLQGLSGLEQLIDNKKDGLQSVIDNIKL